MHNTANDESSVHVTSIYVRQWTSENSFLGSVTVDLPEIGHHTITGEIGLRETVCHPITGKEYAIIYPENIAA